MKKICVIANGFAEEMMATQLVVALREELNGEAEFVAGSLVSSGKWYDKHNIPIFLSGGVSPSGGFPTKTIKGFFADMVSGSLGTPFKMVRQLKQMQDISLVIAVGDFLLMSMAIPLLKKNPCSLIFLPTAKSRYIQDHFRIEKKIIKKYAKESFPRDEVTTQEFQEFGINAQFFGNIMQDLLDRNKTPISSDNPIIALLPGSRDEAYGNLEMILQVVEGVQTDIHWALVQASSLNSQKIADVFVALGWDQSIENTWTKSDRIVYIYSNEQYDEVALGCDMAISLAGTAGEQIVGLGKIVFGFKGSGAQTTHQRMVDNAKLLGEAFIYEQNFPQGIIKQIEHLLNNPKDRELRIQDGLKHMGTYGGTKKIAQYIQQKYLS